MGLRDRLSLKKSASTTLTVATGSDAGPVEISDPAAELRNFRKQHKWDPFLDTEKLDSIDEALDSGNLEKQTALDEALLQEDSPYPEVRVSVPPTDEDVPINTLRAWFIGVLTCTMVAVCNVLLGLRRSPMSISATVVQLLHHHLRCRFAARDLTRTFRSGCFFARSLPDKSFTVFGKQFRLNPGPFNVKEHTIITIMTAAGTTSSYALDILLAQEVFYQQGFSFLFQFLLVLSTQAMGLGVAGIFRRFLVWPSSMVWPKTLITATVMHSLHNHEPADPASTNGWRIGRYKFFLIVAACVFIWEWVPQVFATCLQLFIFATWIAPNNVVVNQLFGGQTGLGLLPISFDWNTVIGFLNSPLQVPSFSLLNMALGLLICTIGTIGLAYGGPDYYKYLPIRYNHSTNYMSGVGRTWLTDPSANQNFDRFAKPYNVSRILTPDFTLNETAYTAYSPVLIGPAFSLSYAMGFACLISTIVHVALFYGADIWNRARNAKYDEPDIHMKLMRKYKETPEWWFLSIFILSFACGLIAALVWDTHLPWWAYILCIVIAFVLFIPVGVIQAISSQEISLNIIMEMIVGYIMPGHPIAMMLFKSWGYMLTYNGIQYVTDMKVGHYMKIPPRSMFAAQAFAVIWLSFIQIVTFNFLLANVKDVCTPNQAQGITCPNARTFYNASVIWGVIVGTPFLTIRRKLIHVVLQGPRRVFGSGGILSWTNYFWLIGFALPVIQYFVARRYPRSIVRYLMFPVIFGAGGMVPPATYYNLWQYVIVGLAFNYFIRRRYFGWWSQYTYVLSAALDIGTALCGAFIAQILGFGSFTFPMWWGNAIVDATLDAKGEAVTKIFNPNTSTPIGPSTW
ncbi:Sexual differentiation process protein isp4 [Tolypocladium capitatum]|uniref:Sexual differentiation process protein isp4 n=1 Tax=Tolypocladium capitatum TaxID=45235 RepID=A0A2K3Q9R8_9HYPO|nr:Sexual differentiation process protein isp4 [Tolypocladium capitatum]